MKFTVLQKNLIKGLNVVSKAVNPRSPLPILNNVLIKTDGGRIKLTASDLSVIISVWVGAKIDAEGEIAIPAKILNDFVSSILDEKIEGGLTESKLTLKSDRFNANFNGIQPSDFPVLENYLTGSSFKVRYADLMNALSRIYFAVATDDTRAILTGFYFSFKNNEDNSGVLKIAGTDGFRMAEFTINLPEPVNDNVSVVIPAKSLFEIVKSLPSTSDEIEIYFHKKSVDSDSSKYSIVTIKATDIEAQIRLISGDYPDYENLVPKEYLTETSVEKSEFENSIKLVSVFAKDQGYAVKFNISDDSIEASSQPTEMGSNVAKITTIKEGEDITISFNGRYLLEFLTNAHGDKIKFKTLGPTKPGLFMVEGENSYWYLVMPIDVNW